MRNLPDYICKLRDLADTLSDENNDVWEKLNNNQDPTLQDLDQWLNVRQRFNSAQEEFEKKLREFINSGLNA